MGGYSFYDVDHNIEISTDHICDYSFYTIRDFHAHPLSGQHIEFLEGLYKMPVEPGLLAWRGISSAVDDVRLGREADLHAHATHLSRVWHEADKAAEVRAADAGV